MCIRDSIYNWLLERRLDFAVVSCDHIPQGFTYDHLMTEHLVLVAPMAVSYTHLSMIQTFIIIKIIVIYIVII